MKTDLPCAVVRDLLPSYTEHLTEEETTRLVRAHLDHCPGCRACYSAMTEDQTPLQEEKQVDYLKKVRKKTWKRVLLAVFCTCLALLLAAGAVLFVIGTPVDPETVFCDGQLSEDGTAMVFSLTTSSSAVFLTKPSVHREDTAVDLRVQQVLVSGLSRLTGASASCRFVLPLEGVKEISYLGVPVWQEGVLISHQANRLWEARTAYAGSASALGQIANRLGLPNVPFKNMLQTDQAPCGWTWEFEAPLSDDQQAQLDRLMFLPLALVENLGEMTWTDSDGHSSALTLSQANEALPRLTEAYNAAHGTDWLPRSSIKDYAENPYTVQQLLDLLEAGQGISEK